MNLKEIKEMIKLMNENDLGELEVEREGAKIKLKKTSSGTPIMVSQRPAEVPMAPPQAPSAVPTPAEEAKSSKNILDVVSPMVGTFYRAPSPEASPFVEVGQVIEVGQVVCIVEAMKLMNEIKAEVRGKVVEIAVENAQPVEFGQTLFGVEPL